MLLTGIGVSAQAQMWIGGSLQLNSTKYKDADVTLSNVTVAPEIGYRFNDNWAIGMEIGYVHQEFSNDVLSNGFIVAPFARYNYLNSGHLSLFVDARVGYGQNEYKGGGKETILNAGFIPGLSYHLSSNVALIGKVGFLGYEYTKDAVVTRKTNSYGLNLDLSNIQLGVVYNF